MDDDLAKELAAFGVVRPPWARHPEIARGSIGWRMGHGEAWTMVFSNWLREQTWTREERLAYLSRFPAPRTFTVAAVHVLRGESSEESIDDLREELEAAGAIRDDAAYRAWRVLHGDDPPPPWRFGGEPAGAVEVMPRELAFVARWGAEARGPGLDGWLATHDATHEWSAFREAMRSGRPPEPLPTGVTDRFGVLLAAHAWAPAPWAFDLSPEEDGEEGNDEVTAGTYTAAWRLWVMGVFDDAGTWDGYLASEPAPPPSWHEALDDARESVIGPCRW